MLSATFKRYHIRIGLSRSFLNRFSNLRRSLRGFASAATLVGYHIRLILSRLFFPDSTVRLETLASFHRAVRNSLLRIPDGPTFVNNFFHFFKKTFRGRQMAVGDIPRPFQPVEKPGCAIRRQPGFQHIFGKIESKIGNGQSHSISTLPFF